MEPLVTWVAPIATTIAALMTASNLGTRVTGWGFAVFLLGSLAWLILGLLTDQPNLVWQNVVLAVLNLFGMWRWLGWKARIEDGGRAAAEASEATPGEALFPVSLLGTAALEGKDGAQLGRAVDAMAGCRSGQIAYLVAGEGGVAGVGESFRRVDWRLLRVDGVRIGIDGNADEFQRLPAIAGDDWPGR